MAVCNLAAGVVRAYRIDLQGKLLNKPITVSRSKKMNYQFHDANTIPWRKSTFAEGIEVKDLGTSDGRSMQLIRFAAGASFPLHRHAGPEFIYLLEGVAVQEGTTLTAGWSAVADAGTTDSNFHSPTGCVFLSVYTD